MDDPEHNNWIRNIVAKTKNDSGMAATFENEIERKFKSITKGDWFKLRNGSRCNGIKYTDAMIQHVTYFNRSFTL